ncbi:hypothetical protein NON08_01915 [Cetobacterium somerae]|uniref:hypothetical protein n=1 Tax=Cetobacterium sp. NK01 TaxID=2993530 RepID=UPI002116AB24|nr:hypothetical protein [Cetobacterium sp. NK01]MCQ8211326.1 hypothetical protein [Cetobacterium sp. NK01]
MKKLKYFIISFALLFFLGCSAIMTSIGNNKINNSINIYNSRGITTDGTLELISGLDYAPDSQIGISQYKKQYSDITTTKNNILKNKYFSQRDINALNLYILTIEEFKKISPKIPEIKIDYNDFNKSKIKIKQIFEEFVLKDEKLYISRNQKIQNINYYKKINKYINSYVINSIILNLENDVTINLYIGSSFQSFSKLDYLVTNSLAHAADINRNRNLGNYIFFKGFTSFKADKSKNYYIDFNFSNIYIRTLETKEEVKENNKLFIARKKITISGYYKIYSQNSTSYNKYFEFNENYSIKMKENNGTTLFDDEYDIVKNILENKFSNIIKFDLNNLINKK